MKATVSAVILAKNEEKNIEKCIKSLLWCDEIIVIDDNSTDKTKSFAEKLGAKIFIRSLNGNFAKQRNFGLEKANGEWVFFVDADEVVSSSLQFEIDSLITNALEGMDGYRVKREDILWGRVLKHGEVGGIWLLRLGKKDKGEWQGAVHETWKVTGKKGTLKNVLLHYPHQTVAEFLSEVNAYSSIRANELHVRHTKGSITTIIFYPLGKFFVNYFGKLGFLDGMPGIIIAMMMSFHSFLVRGKLFLLSSKGRSAHRLQA